MNYKSIITLMLCALLGFSGMAQKKKTFTVNGVSFNMIYVQGGTFKMGANDSKAYDKEKPVHRVTLSDYYIGETEVTQELWEAVMGSNPSWSKGSNKPVETVSWDDCQEFVAKLNELFPAEVQAVQTAVKTVVGDLEVAIAIAAAKLRK